MRKNKHYMVHTCHKGIVLPDKPGGSIYNFLIENTGTNLNFKKLHSFFVE